MIVVDIWREWEVDLLRNNFLRLSNSELSELLAKRGSYRSVKAVRSQLFRMGVGRARSQYDKLRRLDFRQRVTNYVSVTEGEFLSKVKSDFERCRVPYIVAKHPKKRAVALWRVPVKKLYCRYGAPPQSLWLEGYICDSRDNEVYFRLNSDLLS